LRSIQKKKHLKHNWINGSRISFYILYPAQLGSPSNSARAAGNSAGVFVQMLAQFGRTRV